MNLEKERWLYFRTVADEDDDDGDTASAGTSPTSLCVPASSMLSIHPASDTSVQLNFKSVRNSHDVNTALYGVDTVVLTTTQGKTFEVMNRILQHINNGPHHDGFIVVADDMTTNFANATVPASYIHPDISACGAITCAAANNAVANLPSLGMGAAAMTAVTATTLTVNKAYKGATATNLAMIIPSAAAGKAGDWITVLYTTAINNGQAHTYSGATDVNYAPGSVILTMPGADDNDSTRVATTDEATTNDDVITITGLTDGDGGIGTRLKFVNTTGAANGWAVECIVEGRDKQNAAATCAFSAA